MADTFYMCEKCREVVKATDPDVVKAVELLATPTFGSTDEPIEGLGVFFHQRCWSPGPRYRLRS